MEASYRRNFKEKQMETFGLNDELPEEFNEVQHDVPEPDDDEVKERLSDDEGVSDDGDDEDESA